MHLRVACQTFADKSAAIQLALRTLGSFNLQEKLLTEFVRETVVGYLDDEDPYVVVDAAVPLTACNTFSDSLSFRVSCRALCACRVVCRVSNSAIRKAAALTCSSLLVRSNKHAPTRGYLAVVIGEECKNAREEDALDFVLGYTIANDVTARRWQGKKGGGQWIRGKCFDTFLPLGACRRGGGGCPGSIVSMAGTRSKNTALTGAPRRQGRVDGAPDILRILLGEECANTRQERMHTCGCFVKFAFTNTVIRLQAPPSRPSATSLTSRTSASARG